MPKTVFSKNMMLLFLSLILFLSCAKKKATEQAETDEHIIQNYIATHNLNAIATGSGLYYVIDELGTGDECNETSTVTVAYKGYLTNGTVFDESTEAGVTFGLQQVIQGWTEGIPYFKEGGVGKLLIPSALGYGKDKVGSIPKNSVLIFDVKLIEVL